MKVGPRRIKVELAFEDNDKLNSMYVVKYLADRHSGGCLATYLHKAVSSWIKLHHEKDLLNTEVSKFIDETKGTLTGNQGAKGASA